MFLLIRCSDLHCIQIFSYSDPACILPELGPWGVDALNAMNPSPPPLENGFESLPPWASPTSFALIVWNKEPHFNTSRNRHKLFVGGHIKKHEPTRQIVRKRIKYEPTTRIFTETEQIELGLQNYV